MHLVGLYTYFLNLLNWKNSSFAAIVVKSYNLVGIKSKVDHTEMEQKVVKDSTVDVDAEHEL